LRHHLETTCRSSATDAQLARRAAAGNDDAFEKLYERYQPRLEAYCRSIVRHDEDARDAVQNAMTKALVALRRDNDTTNVQGWLFRIAHNEAISVLRRRRPETELHDVMHDRRLGPHGDLLLREELRATLEGIRALPGNLQHALLLRELAGLSYVQVADVVGGTPAAARKAVFDARTALSAARAGRDEACSVIRQSLSEGDGRRRRARVVRSHLQSCHACCDWEREQRRRRQHLHGLLLPGAGAAGPMGWLASIFGGGSTIAAGISGGLATNAKIAASGGRARGRRRTRRQGGRARGDRALGRSERAGVGPVLVVVA
jgi:RNA polymerase sigma factor (sigma-70 family)